MIAKNLTRIVATSKNGSGKAWDTVWIPYHDGVDGLTSIPFNSNTAWYKDLDKDPPGLSWNNRRALLNIASFSKWDDYGTPQTKPCNVNTQFLFSGSPEDSNILRRQFPKNIKAFHPKAQVWKAKLQSCP